MKLIIVIIFLLLTPLVSAGIINIGENQFNITPIINTSSCENTTKVFLIKRENYITGMGEIEINYTQKWNENEINISKSFKSYTSSKTGLIENIVSGNHSLEFILENMSLIWNITINCLEKNVSINTTINETNTSLINDSLNQTENNSIEINESMNQTENLSKEIEVEINKYYFMVGEKLEFRFVSNNKPVTYWIEDSKGNIVKDKYTTSNDNLKTYTFKEQEEEDKIYLLKIEKENMKKEILIGVHKESKEKSSLEISEEKYFDKYIETTIKAYRGNTLKSVITCNTITNNKKSSEEIKIKILDKNSEISSTINFYPKNEWSNKTTILCKGLDLEIEKEIKTENKEETEIKGEIINTYTREKYFDENMSWNVRAKCDEEGIIIIESKNEKQEEKIKGEKTIIFQLNKIEPIDQIKTILLCGDKEYKKEDLIKLKIREEKKEEQLVEKEENEKIVAKSEIKEEEKKEIPKITGMGSMYSPKSKKEKTTTLIITTALLSSLCGILIGFGPKKIIDKFIKK